MKNKSRTKYSFCDSIFYLNPPPQKKKRTKQKKQKNKNRERKKRSKVNFLIYFLKIRVVCDMF